MGKIIFRSCIWKVITTSGFKKHKLTKEKSTKSWIDGKEKYERKTARVGIDGERITELTK